MLAILSLIIILISEYIGDFVLQSRKMALAKSTNFNVLMKHVVTVIGTVFIGASVGFGILWQSPMALVGSAAYAVIYGIIHGIQDWYIWKGYHSIVKERFRITKSGDYDNKGIKSFMENKDYAEDKVFYDFIGLDRILHTITLILLWVWILI